MVVISPLSQTVPKINIKWKLVILKFRKFSPSNDYDVGFNFILLTSLNGNLMPCKWKWVRIEFLTWWNMRIVQYYLLLLFRLSSWETRPFQHILLCFYWQSKPPVSYERELLFESKASHLIFEKRVVSLVKREKLVSHL